MQTQTQTQTQTKTKTKAQAETTAKTKPNNKGIELTYGLHAFEVGERLRLASDSLDHNKRALAFYLADMEKRKLYQFSGHSSTVHFGEAQLDMEHRRTREFIQIGRTLKGLVLVDGAFGAGEISWSKVIALLPVVQRETQQAWVEYTKQNPFREIRDEVACCRPGNLPGEGSHYGLIHKRATVQARLEDVYYAMFEKARVEFSKGDGTLLTDRELIIELLCRVMYIDGPNETKPQVLPSEEGSTEELNNESRNAEELPAGTREAILRRDHDRCRNCGNHLDVEVHHIEFRSQGGSNDPANLVVLCPTCHANVHRGFLAIDGNPNTGSIHFHSGTGHEVIRGERSPPSPGENAVVA